MSIFSTNNKIIRHNKEQQHVCEHHDCAIIIFGKNQNESNKLTNGCSTISISSTILGISIDTPSKETSTGSYKLIL